MEEVEKILKSIDIHLLFVLVILVCIFWRLGTIVDILRAILVDVRNVQNQIIIMNEDKKDGRPRD